MTILEGFLKEDEHVELEKGCRRLRHGLCCHIAGNTIELTWTESDIIFFLSTVWVNLGYIEVEVLLGC